MLTIPIFLAVVTALDLNMFLQEQEMHRRKVTEMYGFVRLR